MLFLLLARIQSQHQIILKLQDKRHIKDKIYFHIDKFMGYISFGYYLILMLFYTRLSSLEKCMELGIGQWMSTFILIKFVYGRETCQQLSTNTLNFHYEISTLFRRQREVSHFTDEDLWYQMTFLKLRFSIRALSRGQFCKLTPDKWCKHAQHTPDIAPRFLLTKKKKKCWNKINNTGDSLSRSNNNR